MGGLCTAAPLGRVCSSSEQVCCSQSPSAQAILLDRLRGGFLLLRHGQERPAGLPSSLN